MNPQAEIRNPKSELPGLHQESSESCDVAVIGGGIVGLATAREWLLRAPGSRVVVLEKDAQVAAHQTGHNSGVIHSGIYYRPGSLKAKTCVAGAAMMKQFCREQGIGYEVCGKVVVATHEAELPRLKTLHERGLANGVEGVALIGPDRLRELEPHAIGLAALHVPGAGIVDYAVVAQAFARQIQERGGSLRLGAQVVGMARRAGRWLIESTGGRVSAPWLISCTGLHSDRLARQARAPADVQIVPFRGEYYDVVPSRRALVKSMIYPVPDPAMPFLGVHFTRTIHGGLHAGPNAVLALAREGYRKRDINLRDMADLARFSGFWKMAGQHWRTGLAEAYRSWCKPAFVRALQRLVPEIRSEDLAAGGSGVRAQAVDQAGKLLDDFNIVGREQAVYVRNVPSPAATASLRIAQLIVEMTSPSAMHASVSLGS